MRKLELAGQQFGRLTVLRCVGIDRRHYTLWECKCECGKTARVKGLNLRLGTTRSCGCILKEVCVKRGQTIGRKNLLRGRPRPGAAFRQVLAVYKQNAKSRNLPWRLTDDQFKQLTQQPCFYSGLAPSSEHRTESSEIYIYNSIDRIDSKKGYTVKNCVPANAAINRMKFDLSRDHFIALCRLVAKRHPGIG